MSKLIGTNPNQVPSNADLGTAAFMDKKDFLLSKGSSLSAIDAVIPNTAVDVFIYDTSKDSDGGAWRKRTQHTSWYNERLNTPIRGSRREFPAVAVIVCTANDVFIYDGDDPSLPMWIKFTESRLPPKGFPNGNTGSSLVAVTAIDGNLFIASGVGSSNIGGGLNMASFVEDAGYTWFNYSIYINYSRFNGNISQRYNGLNSTRINGNTIISNYINDIAVTVLDGSPINPATGLPVPTIAVATDAGVSVIKNNGTVVNLTYTPSTNNEAGHVSFTEEQGIVWTTRGITYGYVYLQYLSSIPSSDYSSAPDYRLNVDSDFERPNGTYGILEATNRAVSTQSGLHLMDLGESKDSRLLSLISSFYNTGWMPGDIKLATLSDTDATDINGTELVTNGTFDSNISGWTNYASARATISWDAGTIKVDNTTGTGDGYVYQTGISLTVGSVVTITMTFTNTTLDAKFYFVNGSSSIGGARVVSLVNGVATLTLAVPTGADGILIGNQDMTTAWNLDNVSMRLGVSDRSINDNGLQVFGNVKKTPVASGADLVSYSGFSNSNYLFQPHNPDISFGASDDFSIIVWVKAENLTGGNNIIDWGNGSSNSNRWVVYEAGGVYAFYDAGAVRTTSISSSSSWTQLAFVRQNGVLKLYGNGVLNTTYATTTSYDNSGCNLHIGIRHTLNDAWEGSLALFRISGTAPSPEQIAKIYEDEKVLFQENAKATLYGTSDAVTALAYDEDTNLLHAGTSAGRSVFQGLRRVDNTTRAVGTAISAVDGFVVEE